MFRISLVLFTAAVVPFCLSQETLRFNRADLTVLGVTMGESSQEQVLAKLGRAPLFRVGTGEGSDDAVCYRSGAQTDDTVVIFHFGALGGWTDVTKISISRGKPPSLRGVTCPPNKAVSHELTFLGGLRLGMSSAAVQKTLGRPSHSRKDRLSYYVSHPCESEKSICVVVDSVEARFDSSGQLNYATCYHFIDK